MQFLYIREVISPFIIFLSCYFVHAQSTISGNISDIEGNPVISTNVLLKDIEKEVIVAFTFSDANGFYELTTKRRGDFLLEFTSMGYAKRDTTIQIDAASEKIQINVQLVSNALELNEVNIKANRPITIGNDTVKFDAAFFLQGNERTVEDLLRRIPGINIDSEGTIKVGNQEIEKLMIEGDDFFEKGYKILSKNMPAHPIEEVQMLRNFSDNHLLKGVEESKKVALNLTIDEQSKRVWFGNVKLAGELLSQNNYQAHTNIMNFGKRNKYYFLTSINNIGNDPTGNVEQLIRPFQLDETGNIGSDQGLSNLIDLSILDLQYRNNRTNFNNAELVSLNAIFNPTKKIKIKPLVFLNWDERDFFRFTSSVVDINQLSFTNTENYQLQNNREIVFGKLDLVYKATENQILEATTKYNHGSFHDSSNLLFNENSINENLRSQNSFFDQKINYTYRLKEKRVFLFTGRFINEKKPQNYRINHFLYEDLFPEYKDVPPSQVAQLIDNQMQFWGVEAHLLDRKQNNDLWEIQLGAQNRRDYLSTIFSLLNDNTTARNPASFQNNTRYQTYDTYLKGKYLYHLNRFSLSTHLAFHQLHNRLTDGETITKQSPFFINPRLSLDWGINARNKLSSSYSFNTSNAEITDTYHAYILSGFRSFSKGTGSFNQLNASTLSLNYQLGNWSDRFFVNTFILYSKNHDFFSTNTIIEQKYTQSQSILIKDRTLLNINSKIDYYFKAIATNLKLDLGLSQSAFKNIINNSSLREINSTSYRYGLELRSGFKSFFNYHIGTTWTANSIKSTIQNSHIDNISFLDLLCVVNDKFDATVKAEYYYFGNLKEDNTSLFLDLNIQYKAKNNKLSIGLEGKNLFNTNVFNNYFINDIGFSITEYRLLPRFLLLQIEYRFS